MKDEGSNETLIDFYCGQGMDSAGRKIDAIWQFADHQLEHQHDYIQWLFPLFQPSQTNPQAPRLDRQTAALFSQDENLSNRTLRSLDMMLAFYGFERDGEDVDRSRDFDSRCEYWLRPNDHNHLRLTRIIQFLKQIGQVDIARSLQENLVELGSGPWGRERVSEKTLRIWRDLV